MNSDHSSHPKANMWRRVERASTVLPDGGVEFHETSGAWRARLEDRLDSVERSLRPDAGSLSDELRGEWEAERALLVTFLASDVVGGE